LDLARPSQRDVDFALRNLPPEARHLAIVERNVVNQLNNVRSYPFIRQRLESDKLALHGWVYHLESQQFSVFSPENDKFAFWQE
jgi:carbonic anhydrase